MPSRKVKIICHWSTPKEARELYKRYCNDEDNYRWNGIELVDTQEADYYVICNFPSHITQDEFNTAFKDMNKVIYFRLEPSYFFNKSLGFFENVPQKAFGYVNGYQKGDHSPTGWLISNTYNQLLLSDFSNEKTKTFSAIISSLYTWPGHRMRVDFLKYLDIVHPEFNYDLFGKSNDHLLKNYKGSLPELRSDLGLVPYKYTFNSENSDEPGYFTEKIINSIVCECLCFYWGCSDLDNWIDPESYIRLDFNDFEKSYNIIISAIHNNEWERRIEKIKKMKYKILNELHFLAQIEDIINKLEMK